MNISRLLPLFLVLISFFACGTSNNVDAVQAEQVIEHYADFVLASYRAAKADAEAMREFLKTFTNDPTAENFEAAKEAWLAARESYGPTEAFRFAGGPIDVIDGEEGPEAFINSWPLDEGYIDYVQDADGNNIYGGIINDKEAFPTVDRELLVSLNMEGGEENVSTGYHAIEFLLWGQDLTAPEVHQAGQRAYTDFVDGGEVPNADRRRAYLLICADLLIENLDVLIDQWEQEGPYRKEFLAQSEQAALSQMMTGIATLSKAELAGERTFVPYANRDQEDEHSCFSDNTHRDLRLNFDGIRDVYLGRMGDNEGPSLSDLIAATDQELADQIAAQLSDAEQAVYDTAVPFDHAIDDEESRPGILAAVNELQDLGNLIVAGGAAIDLTVGTELDK
ncbi:MAG: imelysin family protein [Bacteroidota bacterium]